MEDSKRDSNKQKKPKNDPINQAFVSYLQKKNYSLLSPGELPVDEFCIAMEVESECGHPNSIAYSAINSDPHVIDQNFTKFTTWIKDVRKKKLTLQDLDLLVGPLFCHLYLEILQRDHTDKAINFFNVHYPSVDINKCCDTVKELLNAISMESLDLNAHKNNFRANKYVLTLSNNSIFALKKFMQENCQVVMYQVLQTYFKIIEAYEEVEEHESGDEDNGAKSDLKFMNGHAENKITHPLKQQLLDAICAVKQIEPSVYVAAIANVKDDITAGLINRERGIVVYSYNSGIHIRSLLTLKQLDGMDDYTNEIIFREHSSKVYSFAMMTKENLLVSASHDTTLKLFDLTEKSLKYTYKGHTGPVYCVCTSCDGSYIASGSYDISASLWAIDRPYMLRLCAGHIQEITSIHFHPNSMYFATGSADKTIRMWSIEDGSSVRLLLGSQGVVYSVSYSPCGKFLASAGEDKRIRIWDLTNGKQFVELKTTSEPVVKLTWSKDSKTIAAGSIDGVVKIWDFDTINNNPNETNMQNPFSSIALNAKLLSMEYSFDTFACFSGQSTRARIYHPEEEDFESNNQMI